jgi:hypothetical protein
MTTSNPLYILEDDLSGSEMVKLVRAKQRPIENDPSIFAVQDPRMFEIAKSG